MIYLHEYLIITLFILGIIAIYTVARIAVGKLLYFLSVKHYGDHPGPKIILNEKAEANSVIDWLLIHGASADARIWKGTLSHCNTLAMAAISIGWHERAPNLAQPNLKSAADLTSFLQQNKVHVGMAGHSTAAMWMASSYRQNPENWNTDLKILLIAPNFGNNVTTFSATFLKIISYILPNPYISILPKNSCCGTSKIDSQRCLKLIGYGRKLMLHSIPYYQSIISYMQNEDNQNDMLRFLEKFSNNITIILGRNDHVINNTITLEMAHKFNIKTIEIETSHSDLINYARDYL